MNERIKLLAEQAGVNLSSFQFSGTPTKYEVAEHELERFAELIVKECSAFANHFSDGHEKDQFGRKMFHYKADIGQVILEHFGVES